MVLGRPRKGLRAVAAVLWLLVSVACGARPARALPVFAHRFGLSCQACHTVVPHLTGFGQAFLAAGYRIPNAAANHVAPIAVKVNLQYASEAEEALPKAVVDEIEVLAGGAVGRRGSYFAEQYVVDGGLPGRTRDAWFAWRATPDGARVPVTLRGGRFTLDIPLDPETFRETTDHYAIWDQTAGENAFTLFDDKLGLAVAAGEGRSFSGSIAALQGHDTASGLPSCGLDRALFVQHAAPGLLASAYRYDGTRPVAGGGDRFWRQGYGVSALLPRTEIDAVYQHGLDVHASAAGGVRTSGGFLQLRYELSPRAFAIARYDATQDDVFSRAMIAGLGYRPARNMRLTVFDTVHREAATGARRNTLSSALLFAY